MGQTASDISAEAKKNSDGAEKAAAETLYTLFVTTKSRMKDFKTCVLDPIYCQSEGFIPVDQVITEIDDVRVQTSEDAQGLQDAVGDIVDSAFKGDWSALIKGTVNLAVTAISGATAGTMSEKTTYILSLKMGRGGTVPAIEVLNLYVYSYSLEYTGVLNDRKAVFGYTAVSGSIAKGAIHEGTLQNLLENAQSIYKLGDKTLEQVKQQLIQTYLIRPHPHLVSAGLPSPNMNKS